MGWGSKQTTTGTNSSTTTPNLNPLAQGLYGQLSGEAHNLIADANKPVYGDAQKAEVLNNLNDLANAASKHLNSSLASRGALGSGDFTTGQSNIEQQRLGNLSNFYTNLPAAEDAAHQQRMMQALGFGAGLAGQMPVGQTSEGTQSQTQTSSPGWSSLVGALAGGATSMLTGGLMGGLGGMMGGGGGFGSGFSQAMNPYSMPVPYGGMNFSPPMQGYNPYMQAQNPNG